MLSKMNWFICGPKLPDKAIKDSPSYPRDKEDFERIDYPVFDKFCNELGYSVKADKSTLLKHDSFLFAFTEIRDVSFCGNEKFLSIGMRKAPLPGPSSDPDKLQWSPIQNIQVDLAKEFEVSTTSFLNCSKNQKLFIFVSLVKPRSSDPIVQWKVIFSSSSDYGVNWSEWRDLTPVIKQMRQVGSKFFTTSPGRGIELQNGSLMIFGRFYKSYDSFTQNKKLQVAKDDENQQEFDFEKDVSCCFFLTSYDLGENWVLQNGPKGFVYATLENRLLNLNDCNIVEYKTDCLFFLATARKESENILVSSRSFNSGKNWDKAVALIRNKPSKTEILTKFNLLEVTYNGYVYLIMCRCVRSCEGDNGGPECNIVLSASKDGGSKWSSSWPVRHNKSCRHVDMCVYMDKKRSTQYLVILYEEQDGPADVSVNYIHVPVKECLKSCLGAATLT